MVGLLQFSRLFEFTKPARSICGCQLLRQQHSLPEGGRSGGSGPKDKIAKFYHLRQELLKKWWINANERYERFVGLADVQRAQDKVKQAETAFLEARAHERAVLREMVATREELKNVRERLSHVDYSNTMYLQLASDQHELVTREEKQKRELEEAEDFERDSFSNLSNAMRESYEQERARVERTKNWSVIGTVIGTIIGMMGSIYMNRVRTKDLMKAVMNYGDHSDVSASLEKLESTIEEKQQAIATVTKDLSEHVSEMSNALQVQNMEVLSGFVQGTFKDIGTAPINHKQLQDSSSAAALQLLSDEIEQYNKALLSLSNAVVALTNVDSANLTGGTKIQGDLEKLINNSSSIYEKLDKIILAANEVNVKGIFARLDSIDDHLRDLHNLESKDRPAIYELQEPSVANSDVKTRHAADFSEVQPNWRMGIKDIALWGSALCCLYLIMKF